MIELDEERIGSFLRGLLTKRAREKERSAVCPDEESLANYLTGALPDEARSTIEAHLADCSFCLDEIVAVHRSTLEKVTETVPQRIVDKAMALVSGPKEVENFLDLIIRLVKDSLELVSTSGQLILTPAPVGIRGGAQPSDRGRIEVHKEIGRFKIHVAVERIESGLCQVAVWASDEVGRPAEGVRLSMISEGRERASYLTRQGQVVFDRVPQGEYNLAISDLGAPIGTIRLAVVEGHHEGERPGP